MADLSRCRPGNWLLYIPQNQYCTFVAKEMYVVVEMFDGRRDSFEDDLTFIKISNDVLSVCKFTMRGAVWTKQVAGKTLTVTRSTAPTLTSPPTKATCTSSGTCIPFKIPITISPVNSWHPIFTASTIPIEKPRNSCGTVAFGINA